MRTFPFMSEKYSLAALAAIAFQLGGEFFPLARIQDGMELRELGDQEAAQLLHLRLAILEALVELVLIHVRGPQLSQELFADTAMQRLEIAFAREDFRLEGIELGLL